MSASAGLALVALSSPGVIGRNLGPSNCEPACVYRTFGLVNDGSLTLL